MALYIYPKDSPIDRLYILKTEKGDYRAYLHASTASDTDTRKAIVKELETHRWHGIPTTHLDMQCLEVRGFGSEEELFNVLKQKKWVHGNYKKLPTPGDNLTLTEIVQKRSLQASGILYAIGDYGFITYGFKEKDPLVAASGFAYAAGTWSLVGFGKNNHASQDIEDLSKRMATYLQEHKNSIPSESSMTRLAQVRHKSILESTSDLFSHYPSEVFCVVTGLAGALVAAANYNKLKVAKPGETLVPIMDIGLGTTTLAACMLGLFIREKHRDPDEPAPTSQLGKVWEWIKEKPLRVTGYGLMISTMFHAASTVKDYTHAMSLPIGDAFRTQKLSALPGRAQFVGCNMLAEFMMAISSKGHGDGVETDESVSKSMIAVASEMIAKKPPEYHEELIAIMTKFLGDPTVLGLGNQYIREALCQGVESAMKNPWATDFVTWRNNPNNPDVAKALAEGNPVLDTKAPDAVAILDGQKPQTTAQLPVFMQQRVATAPALEQQHKPS